jgi:hypothetical protein
MATLGALPNLVSPAVLTPYDSPSKYEVKLIPPPPFQPLPDYGWQQADKEIAQAGPQIASDILNSKVNAATRQTELQQQQVYQARLTSLQHPVDAQGNPMPAQIPYVVNMGGPGQGTIEHNPVTLSQLNNVFGSGPYIPNSNTPQTPTPQTQPQTNQPQPQNQPPNAPVAPVNPKVYNDVTNPQLQATPGGASAAPAQNNVAQSAPAPTLAPPNAPVAQAKPIPTSALAVDTAANLPSQLATPRNVLGWYQDRINSQGKDARAETDPATGQPTGRVIVSHDPRSGLADQPIDPGQFQLRLNGWKPDNAAPSPAVAPNPVLAGGSALSTAAAAPIAQNISQNLAQGANVSPLLTAAMGGTQAGNGNDQNDLANSLAAGTLSPAQVLSAGGPQWAGTRTAPQAPPGHIGLRAPGQMVLPNAPISGAAQGATAAATPSPGPTPLPPPDQKPDTFGLSAQEVLAQAQNAADKGKFGTDTSVPMWNTPNGGSAPGKPSMTVPIIGKDGKPGTGFVDSSGGGLVNASTVYTRQGDGYTWESRDYLDGTHKDVQLSIGPEQDKAMMNTVVDQGFANPTQWLQWTPDQKESAYRLAANQKNTTSSEPTNQLLAKRQDVITSGMKLQDAVKPLSLQDRNALALAYNAKVNQFGSILGIKDNPQLSAAQAAYSQFMNDVRTQETNRPASDAEKLGVGIKDSEYSSGSIGNLSDQSFMPNLQKYLGNQGRMMSRDVDQALASKYRVSDQILHSANLIHMGTDALGSTQQNPISVSNMQDYAKAPKGSYVRDANTGTIVLKGTNGIVHP